MKWLKVFSFFIVLHAAAWICAHWYKSHYPTTVLLVADTSFALKPNFVEMQRWIEHYGATSRYKHIMVGTDKALIGPLGELKSPGTIFRVSFGRSTPDSLRRYSQMEVDEKIFLSDGTFDVPGWKVIEF